NDMLVVCNAKRYRADDVEHTVWTWIDTDVLDEAHIRTAIAERADSAEDDRVRLQAERESYYRKLAELEEAANRAAQLYIAKIYTLEEVTKAKAGIDAAKESTDKELARVETQLQSLVTVQSAAEQLYTLVRTIRAKLDTGVSNVTKRQIL